MIIELIDKNDEIPQFVALDQNGRYDGRVAENLAPGAEVLQVTATDRDEFPEYNKVSTRINYLFFVLFIIKYDFCIVVAQVATFLRKSLWEGRLVY